MRRIRDRITYANVMATAALFLAIGGGAYAAGLKKNSVTTKAIKNGAVTAPKLKARAVKSKDLGLNAVGTNAVADGAITASKLAADSVGTSAIADRGVGGADLADRAVNARSIAAHSVKTAKIDDGAVTPDKLGGSFPAARAQTPAESSASCQIASGSATPLVFTGEAYDNATMHTPGTSCGDAAGANLVAPRAGIFLVSAGIVWPTGITGEVSLSLTSSSATFASQDQTASGTGSRVQNVSGFIPLTAGQSVQASALQATGSPVQIPNAADPRNYLQMVWVAPGP